MRLVFRLTLLCLLLWSSKADAQGDTVPVRDSGQKKEVYDKKFLALGIAMHGAMIVDLKTTFDNLRLSPQAYETNSLARPFVERGPIVTYASATAFQVGVIYVSAKMRESENSVIRNMWWVPKVTAITLHILAADFNRREHARFTAFNNSR